jgi:hypothetical protein
VQQRASQSYTFGLFGDLAYVPEREKQLDAVLVDINRTPMAFVVHVGDLGGPQGGSCTDALWARRFQQFSMSINPLIYTPGDNDWTDGHDERGVKGGAPSERLAKLRALFFQGDETMGQRKFQLIRQSLDPKFARYRENARRDLGEVTFITLHVVGSNNYRARTAEADLAWLRAGFAHVKANNSRAIMIIQQANMQYVPRIAAVFRQPRARARRLYRVARRRREGGAGLRQACGAG